MADTESVVTNLLAKAAARLTRLRAGSIESLGRSAYLFFLGREPESERVALEAASGSGVEIASRFVESDEFKTLVMPLMIEGRALGSRFIGAPAPRDLSALARFLPLSDAGRRSLESASTWRDAHRAVFGDGTFREAAGVRTDGDMEALLYGLADAEGPWLTAACEAVADGYRFFLGREPETRLAAFSKRSLSKHELAVEFLASEEFRGEVLEPYLRGSFPRPERFIDPPTARLLRWAVEALAIAPPTERRLLSSSSWPEVFAILIEEDVIPRSRLGARGSYGDRASAGSAAVNVVALYDLVLAREPEPGLPPDAYRGQTARQALVGMIQSEEFEARMLRPLQRGAAWADPALMRSMSSASLAWAKLAFGSAFPKATLEEAPARAQVLSHLADALALPNAELAEVRLWSSASLWGRMRELTRPPEAEGWGLSDYRLADGDPTFDRAWYLAQNADVAEEGMDPLRHFLISGWREGRNPSARFNTARYRRLNRDVDFSDTNPLLDHLRRQKEGLSTSGFYGAYHASRRGDLPRGEEWPAVFSMRLAERMRALKGLDLSPPFQTEGPTFSIIMTVFDTPPVFLRALFDSVMDQAFTDFEWIILDNGSQERSTIQTCEFLSARDERIRLYRVEKNLHIIGGNRYALDRARGRYVVPIDSDDLLYPDSLALFANALRDAPELPSMIYSDEQKIDSEGRPLELIWRWTFSYAHAICTAPAAHLLAFEREQGLAAGVYTDDYARGSHDWDTALRLADAGGHALHVPEVLYGWRVHGGSTAMSTATKSYIAESQLDVMKRSLQRRRLEDKIAVEPLFEGQVGWYGLKRVAAEAPSLLIDFICGPSVTELENLRLNLEISNAMPARRRVFAAGGDAQTLKEIIGDRDIEVIPCPNGDALASVLRETPPGLFARAFVSSFVRVAHADAFWAALAVLEADHDAGIVCGPIIGEEGVVFSAGLLSGLDGLIASPFGGWNKSGVPGHLWRVTRPVSATPALFFVVRSRALRDASLHALDDRGAQRGIAFCFDVARLGLTTIYAWRLEAISTIELPVQAVSGVIERRRLIDDYGPELDRRPFSPLLSARGSRFGLLPTPDEGEASGVDFEPFTPARPLNLVAASQFGERAALNVLIPAIRMSSMSGGPNTAYTIAMRLAQAGVPVRLLSTDVPPDADRESIWRHITTLVGASAKPPNIEIVDASDRGQALRLGRNDVFMATAWWTAQMARAGSKAFGDRPFVYLIQDFEPLLYPASSAFAQSLETYGFDHVPLVNTELLFDFLTEFGHGKFKDPDFARDAIVFEPAVDAGNFYGQAKAGSKRKLLFYARPATGERNLYELGVAALQLATQRGLFGPEWEFLAMGDPVAPVPLGTGSVLSPAPWWTFPEYAQQIRDADIVLSLMLSPHPSYPPLEAAACGAVAVTNTYANKTSERLAELSPNIVGVEADFRSIADGLAVAVERIEGAAKDGTRRLSLPGTWTESLQEPLRKLVERLSALGVSSERGVPSSPSEVVALSQPSGAQGSSYQLFLDATARRREQSYPASAEVGLLCFVTTVWNTAPAYLEVLARSLQNQDLPDSFVWRILDNGSTRDDTRDALEIIAKSPYVEIDRVEVNLGIIGGMAHVVAGAKGRYILPLDSDDYLRPECARVLTWYIQKLGYPSLLYTDEDLLREEDLFLPYMKPDWDPVLFSNSCYIAHLCAIDREIAQGLGCYTDSRAEGSHDWDTFTRFLAAGHVPAHVPELLYSWRVHAGSTAGNIEAKPVVYGSQLAVLERLRASLPFGDRLVVEKSPLFEGSPDWWFRRDRSAPPPPLTTILVRGASDSAYTPDLKIDPAIDHDLVEVSASWGLRALLPHVRRCATEGRLVHILASETHPDDDEWLWEAVGLLESYGDCVGVGGRLHSHGVVIEAGRFLGFGDGCGSPDRGRQMKDSGYFGQMWKPHSVDAFSASHAVFRADFLAHALLALEPDEPTIHHLGAWLGGIAAEQNARFIYSPFLSAETYIDWDALVAPAERERFAARFGHLFARRPLRSPNLGRDLATGYMPTISPPAATAQPAISPYPERFNRELRRRGPGIGQSDVGFSLLTTLYEGTNASLFAETAKSVTEQIHGNWEWIVLIHGTVSSELRSLVESLSRESRVLVFELESNLGIIGGMRFVLEKASNPYVVPLDGDDLLTRDALALLGSRIANCDTPPALVYTDEDALVGGAPTAPYLRPCWDPVLDLENSWIWHLTALRREDALSAALYSDTETEYCHDWDSVARLSATGRPPLHVPAVAYHWRQHAASTSHRAEGPDRRSAISTKSLLNRKIFSRDLSDTYEVVPYPIWRGAEEWGIAHRAPDLLELPPVLSLHEGWEAIEERLAALRPGQDIVLLAADDLDALAAGAIAEARKFFDFIAGVEAICGRVEVGGRVGTAALFVDHRGALCDPYAGLDIEAPGPYAMALKPQVATVPNIDLCFVRAQFMREAVEARPRHLAPTELGWWLGAFAAARGRLIAYSPLVIGRGRRPRTASIDPFTTPVLWSELLSQAGVQRLDRPTGPGGFTDG